MQPGNNDFPPVDWRAELPQINSLTLHPYDSFTIPSYSHSSTPSDSSSSGGNGSVNSPQGLAQGPGYVHQTSSRHHASQQWESQGGATPMLEDPPFDPRRHAHAQGAAYPGHGHGEGFIADNARQRSYDSAEGSPRGSSRSLGSGSYSDRDASSPEGGYDAPIERSHPRHNEYARAQYSSSRRAALEQQRAGSEDAYHSHSSSHDTGGSRSYYRPRTHIAPEDPGYLRQYAYRPNDAGSHTSIPPQLRPSPPPGHSPPTDHPLITASGRRDIDDPGPMLRQLLNIPPHVPLNLHAIPDPPPGEKPKQPYPVLVQLAIYGSRNKRLTLQEIYAALEERFDWFKERSNEMQWKNSIRHNLSLNKVFRQVPRPITEPGKGKYWIVDLSEGTGNKRERKRNRKKKTQSSTGDAEQDSSGEESEDTEMSHSQQSHSSRNQYAQRAPGPSSSSTHSYRSDEMNIDPRLRDAEAGHSVGEGRMRGSVSPRRAGPASPYPSPPPMPLRLPSAQSSNPSSFSSGGSPSVSSMSSNTSMNAGHTMGSGSSSTRSPPQHTSLSRVTQGPPGAPRFGQPAFGQAPAGQAPAFGQPSFGASGQPPSRTSSSSSNYPRAFMAAASEQVALGPVAASSGRPVRDMSNASRQVVIPEPTPKPGVEYYREGGLLRARRVGTPGSSGDNGSQGSHSEEDVRRSSRAAHR